MGGPTHCNEQCNQLSSVQNSKGYITDIKFGGDVPISLDMNDDEILALLNAHSASSSYN